MDRFLLVLLLGLLVGTSFAGRDAFTSNQAPNAAMQEALLGFQVESVSRSLSQTDAGGSTPVRISVGIDYYYSEGTWNLMFEDGTWLYSSHQSFSSAYDSVTVSASLSDGVWYLYRWDTWGDGGIDSIIIREDTGTTLLSADPYDYSAEGVDAFSVDFDAVSTPAPTSVAPTTRPHADFTSAPSSEMVSVTMTISIDDWPEEASWNMKHEDGTWLYDSTAAGSVSAGTIELWLKEGEWSLYRWDTYGDGGIGCTIYDSASGDVLLSVGPYTYSYQGVDDFIVGTPEDLPSLTAGGGSGFSGTVPDLSVSDTMETIEDGNETQLHQSTPTPGLPYSTSPLPPLSTATATATAPSIPLTTQPPSPTSPNSVPAETDGPMTTDSTDVYTDVYFDIIISFSTDYWPEEASWNLMYEDGTWLYSSAQGFGPLSVQLSLLQGEWSLYRYDTYGDGGISATIYDAATGEVLLSVGAYSYSYQDIATFIVGASSDLPSLTAGAGSGSGGDVPDLSVVSTTDYTNGDNTTEDDASSFYFTPTPDAPFSPATSSPGVSNSSSYEPMSSVDSSDVYFDIVIEFSVDFWPDEASWNLMYEDGTWLYSSAQGFGPLSVQLSLLQGEWSLYRYDAFGDGGISATIYDAATGEVLLSVGAYSYSYQDIATFIVGDSDLPSLTSGGGSGSGGDVPSLTLASTFDEPTSDTDDTPAPSGYPDDSVQVTLVVSVDFWPEEASWNLMYEDGTWLYSSAQGFSSSYSSQTISLWLQQGEWLLYRWDDYGDGGISATIYDAATDEVLLSVGAYSYSYQDIAAFIIGNPDLPSLTAGGSGSGSGSGDSVPSLSLTTSSETSSSTTFTVSSAEGMAWITISVAVDWWPGEASWNVRYEDGTWLYSSDQSFSTPFASYSVTEELSAGEWTLYRWDAYGDGGIDCTVANEETGEVLLNLDAFSYSYQDAAVFVVDGDGSDVPSLSHGGSGFGSGSGDNMPSLTLDSSNSPTTGSNPDEGPDGFTYVSMTIMVDLFYGEASWNLRYEDGSWLYPSPQTFSISNWSETRVELLQNGAWVLYRWDGYGDGGIAVTLEDLETGDVLLSVGMYSYTMSAEDEFFVGPAEDVPSLSAGTSVGSGSGSGFIPSLSVTSSTSDSDSGSDTDSDTDSDSSSDSDSNTDSEDDGGTWVFISLNTDFWPEEASWNLLFVEDETWMYSTSQGIVSGGSETREVFLKAGEWALYRWDTFGDGGLSCTITERDTGDVLLHVTMYSYGYSAEDHFYISAGDTFFSTSTPTGFGSGYVPPVTIETSTASDSDTTTVTTALTPPEPSGTPDGGGAYVLMSLQVDFWAGEASYNLRNAETGSFYFAQDQGFSYWGQYVSVEVFLSAGTWELHRWDAYGDGGISATLTYSKSGEMILSVGAYDYGYNSVSAFEIVADDGGAAPPDTSDELGENEVLVVTEVDMYPTEASWNIQREDGSFVFATALSFTMQYEVQSHVVALEEGAYIFRRWDGWGDGGITVTILNADGDELLYSHMYSYSWEASDVFYVGDVDDSPSSSPSTSTPTGSTVPTLSFGSGSSSGSSSSQPPLTLTSGHSPPSSTGSSLGSTFATGSTVFSSSGTGSSVAASGSSIGSTPSLTVGSGLSSSLSPSDTLGESSSSSSSAVSSPSFSPSTGSIVLPSESDVAGESPVPGGGAGAADSSFRPSTTLNTPEETSLPSSMAPAATPQENTTSVHPAITTTAITSTASLTTVPDPTTQPVETPTPTTTLAPTPTPTPTPQVTTVAADPCAVLDCVTNSHCVADSDATASCVCDEGYEMTNGACKAQCDGCASGTCSAPGVCTCTKSYLYYDETTLDCEVDQCIASGDDACSGHGVCSRDGSYYTCDCDDGYTGAECDTPICENDCFGQGTCVAPDTCTCDCNWQGYCYLTTSNCELPDCSMLSYCSEHGECSSPGKCTCDEGYAGTDCSLLTCPNDCSQHGTTTFSSDGVYGCDGTTGICTCASGYTGDDCSVASEDEVRTCPMSCSGLAGTCQKPEYVCNCPDTHFGSGCQYQHCPAYNDDCDLSGECDDYCNGRGGCDFDTGECECANGAYGSECQSLRCAVGDDGSTCGSAGTCDSTSGVCVCEAGRYGDTCEFTECPRGEMGVECSNEGVCDDYTGVCECNDDHWGDACEHLACPAGDNGEMCSGNGSPYLRVDGVSGCDVETGECLCYSGWYLSDDEYLLYQAYSGDACETSTCPSQYSDIECSGNGECSAGVCECDSQDGVALYLGEACHVENPDAVPENEGVAKVRSSMALDGISADSLTPELCDALIETIAEVLGVSTKVVTLEECDALSQPSRRRADDTTESTSMNLNIELKFVTNAEDEKMSSAAAMSSTISQNSEAMGSSVSNTVSTQTGASVSVASESVAVMIPCPGDCSGRGTCDTASGVCTCDDGWSWDADPSCKVPECFDGTNFVPISAGYSIFEGCNFMGECVAPNSCSCYDGYSGTQCEVMDCPANDEGAACSDHGRCLEADECTCEDSNSWTGCDDSLTYCELVTPLCFAEDYSLGEEFRSACARTCSKLLLDDWAALETYPELYETCNELSFPAQSHYSGDACAVVGCSGCFGHGTCAEPWVCQCEDGYSGDDCSVAECVITDDESGEVCSGHGTCTIPNVCECDDGWSGSSCSRPDCSGCSEFFSSNSHYTCVEPYTTDSSVCICEDGWLGDDCTTPSCDNDICSCEMPDVCATCHDQTLTGSACQYTKECPTSASGPCNGNGGCLEANVCTCYETELGTYEGDECDIIPCGLVDECNGHGTCIEPNLCACDEDSSGRLLWTGASCNETVCPTDASGAICGNHGTCAGPLACECDFGFTGEACDTDVCSFVACSASQTCVRVEDSLAMCVETCDCEHGTCSDGSSTCTCDEGYFGATCHSASPLSFVQGSLVISKSASQMSSDVLLQIRDGLARVFNTTGSAVSVSLSSPAIRRHLHAESESGGTSTVAFAVYGLEDEGAATAQFDALTAEDIETYCGVGVVSVGETSLVAVEVGDPTPSATDNPTVTELQQDDNGDTDQSATISLSVMGGVAFIGLIVFGVQRGRARRRRAAGVAPGSGSSQSRRGSLLPPAIGTLLGQRASKVDLGPTLSSRYRSDSSSSGSKDGNPESYHPPNFEEDDTLTAV